jgi:hypothetical protein
MNKNFILEAIGYFIVMIGMIGGMIYQTINYREHNVD